MAPPIIMCFTSSRKVVVLYLVILLIACFALLSVSSDSESPLQSEHRFLGSRRRMLETHEAEEQDDDPPTKKLTKKATVQSSSSSKNQTKLTKSNLSSKNQTKSLKSNLSSMNQTKSLVLKPTNSTKTSTPTAVLDKVKLKTLNSTSKFKKLNSTATSKPSNSTKTGVSATKKTLDLSKPSAPKNKTTTNKEAQLHLEKKLSKADNSSKKQSKNRDTDQTPPKTNTHKTSQKTKQPSWVDQDADDEDLVSEFRDLPNKFQQTLIPDLERISSTSKAYLTQANKHITRGFKPYVGNKYAPTIATLVSCAFILIPLLLVSLVFTRIKAYFSLQRLLIFVQVYLSIYFTILCLSSLLTGLEPLRFFYATSASAYVCIQILQTLGYVMYLLLLLMYLVLVFSTESGLGSKFLGLAQTFVGYAVGLHYYVAVFHRMVLHQPPKTNWKVHGVYATCFMLICLFARAEWRKKAYLEEGGGEGKKS